MAASLDWILREPLGHTLPQPHPFPHGLGGGDPGIALFCPTQNGIAERGQIQTAQQFLMYFQSTVYVSFSATYSNKYLLLWSIRKVSEEGKTDVT